MTYAHATELMVELSLTAALTQFYDACQAGIDVIVYVLRAPSLET